MTNRPKRTAAAVTILGVLIAGTAIALFLRGRADEATAPDASASPWSVVDEGFLAVATPCCADASLWDALDTTTPDDQRARPASAAEVADWLNRWPYRSRDEADGSPEEQLRVAARGSDVRCFDGKGFGDRPALEADLVRALQQRSECEYSRWQAWTPATANGRLPERHTVWADADGHFHGRVKYKTAE